MGEAAAVFTQFQNVAPNNLDQFRDGSKQPILWPPEYKTGDMIYPVRRRTEEIKMRDRNPGSAAHCFALRPGHELSLRFSYCVLKRSRNRPRSFSKNESLSISIRISSIKFLLTRRRKHTHAFERANTGVPAIVTLRSQRTNRCRIRFDFREKIFS